MRKRTKAFLGSWFFVLLGISLFCATAYIYSRGEASFSYRISKIYSLEEEPVTFLIYTGVFLFASFAALLLGVLGLIRTLKGLND